MKKKLINIQDITVVMNRASRGLTIEGVMFIDKHTHHLTFKPYNLAKYQPGYYQRAKPKLIKKLPWGALKQSIRNNILRLSDDPDVNNVIKYLREREIVHYQRFGEALRRTLDRLDEKNVYALNPSF